MVKSAKRTAIKDGLAGLVAGAALGFIIVLLGVLLSDRLRRRSDVAEALGAPVELTLGDLQPPRRLKQSWLRRQLQEPSPPLLMIERRLRGQLDSAPMSALALIEIEAADVAALAIALLARSLASEGTRVLMADLAEGRPLATLFEGRVQAGQVGMVSISGQPIKLFVAPDDPTQNSGPEADEDTDMILIVATVDPAFGAQHIADWASDAVVMVQAGEANAVRIDSVGELLRQARIAVRSAILLGGDSNDDSSGVPDAYRQTNDLEEDLLGTLRAADR